MTTSLFAELGVAEPLCRALVAANYITPTPIQLRAIPMLLTGRDLLGIAQTGTGKTAAFALPILQRLSLDTGKRDAKTVRALILAPTRELVIQIEEAMRTYGRHLNLRFTAVYGGVNQFRQVKALANGVDILVATPGRLLDLMNQKHVRLDRVNTLVLDEADRMLDMGFIRDVKKIIATVPKERQSLLFSATMPSSIAHLAAEILNDPLRVEVTPEVVTVDKIDQHVLHVDAKRKRELLQKLLADPELARVIVFTRTKHCANRVCEQLEKSGVSTTSIHGNKSQNARQKALEEFRNGDARVLIATDIAARGIDVTGITHVINYELPDEPEAYVHRIGRTARAGKNGIALAFCDASERRSLRDIERLVRKPLQVMDISALMGGAPMVFEEEPRRPRQPQGRRPQKAGGKGRPHGSHTRDGQDRDRSKSPNHAKSHGHGDARGHADTRGNGHPHGGEQHSHAKTGEAQPRAAHGKPHGKPAGKPHRQGAKSNDARGGKPAQHSRRDNNGGQRRPHSANA